MTATSPRYRHTSASRCASLGVCVRCVFICGNENITQTKNQIHSILSIQVRKRGDLVCRFINFINFKSMLIKSELFESCWTVSHLVKWANFNPPSPYIYLYTVNNIDVKRTYIVAPSLLATSLLPSLGRSPATVCALNFGTRTKNILSLFKHRIVSESIWNQVTHLMRYGFHQLSD